MYQTINCHRGKLIWEAYCIGGHFVLMAIAPGGFSAGGLWFGGFITGAFCSRIFDLEPSRACEDRGSSDVPSAV